MTHVSIARTHGLDCGCAHSELNDNQRKYVYDTSLYGYANTGHTFGDHLTDSERKALLEYLKTL